MLKMYGDYFSEKIIIFKTKTEKSNNEILIKTNE